jgi:hypothetical protein
MIWLSREVEFKNIVMTLNTCSLEFVGVYHFFVREKKVVTLHEAEVPQYCLYLSTETEDYGSTVTVSRKKYEQARLGKLYGLCSVIKNIKHDYYIVYTEDANPDTAIKQLVRKSRLKMLFFITILGLCLGTLLSFIYPLLYLSWN